MTRGRNQGRKSFKHVCGTACECPLHGPRYYHRPTDTHACTVSDCEVDANYKKMLEERWIR